MSTEITPESRVIVISGDNGCTADAIHRMLAEKDLDHGYEVLTRDEAVGRGLMLDERPERLRTRMQRALTSPYGKPDPHPERDAWNAAIDTKKAERKAP